MNVPPGPPMRVLVLAGTREARELVDALAVRDDVEVTASLAGRTTTPALLACPVRVGGFDGPAGLARHLADEAVDVLVDATHPFAREIPFRAAEAAANAGVARLRLRRAPFARRDGDRWVEVRDASAAADALRVLEASRVLLTTGRRDLDAFGALDGVHLVIRSVEAATLPGATIIEARGPFSFDEELALLRAERIDALVTKDSGGVRAKLDAAREAAIPVVVIRRPPDPGGPLVETVGEALAWLDRLRPPAAGAHGGDAARVARWLGVPADEVLDLSVSLNPFAPPAAQVIEARAGEVARYPDASEATAALAKALGVDPRRLVLTNGGAEAIALVAALEPVGWVEDPEFSLYARHLEDVRRGAPRWRSNPSNPRGRLAGPGEAAEVWDEAFYPLATGAWTRGDATSWRLGSFTKVWSCPGLRLGYAIAPSSEQADELRSRQPRWAVNALAVASVAPLLASTDLPAWADAIREQRERLVESLRNRELEVADTEACWVLVEEPHLRERLAPQGVVVRDCASFGLDGVARIAVPDDAGLARLLHALDAVGAGR